MIDSYLNFDPAFITAGASALTGIASTIAGISRANDQQKFEQQLSLLSNQQLQNLNEQLMQTQDQEQRLSILTNSLNEYAVAGVKSAGISKNVIYVMAGVLAISVLMAAIFLTKSSKN